MRFADPQLCPDCRGFLAPGVTRCPRCGIDLQDPDLRELWQTLLTADELLARAVARRDAAKVTQQEPQPAMQQPTTQQPTMTQPVTTRPPAPPPAARSWSVGTVLLGLGATGLVVAAIIFVSRSWDSIGLLGKALVLAAATGAAVAAAVWVTRRPLRASAEALWAVALALLTLDLVGARGEGLLGLDAVPWAWALAVSGVVVAAASAGVLLFARPHVQTDLVTAALGSTAGIALAAGGASQVADVRPFWQQFVALVVAGLLGLALRPTGSRLLAWGARGVVAICFVGATVLAVVEAVENPSLAELTADAHGVPLLLVSLAAVVVGAAIAAIRAPMAVVAVLTAGLLVVLAAGEAWTPDGGFVAAAVLTVLVTAGGRLDRGAWTTGVAWSALPGLAVLVGLAGWWAVDLVASFLDESVESLDPAATIVCGLAVVAVPLLWRRPTLAVAAVALAVHAVVASFDPPRAAEAGVWVLLGVVAAVVAVRDGLPWVRRTAGAPSAPLVVGGVAVLVDAAGASTDVTVLVALAVAAVCLVATRFAPPVPRWSLEAGAALAVVAAAGSGDSVVLGAACWTAVGVVLLAVAVTTPDRRWYVWPGLAALVVAYVLLVVDSGFSFVEAYTLPIAAVALGGGAVLLRRSPETGSWLALGPGLVLGLAPSVPQALAEPTGLRALLLGLAAVVVLGIGLRLGQQASFLLGSAVALLVVLANIGPYANAAPRVLVISVVSVVLVGLGITWEDRVRDGRRVLAAVREMT